MIYRYYYMLTPQIKLWSAPSVPINVTARCLKTNDNATRKCIYLTLNILNVNAKFDRFKSFKNFQITKYKKNGCIFLFLFTFNDILFQVSLSFTFTGFYFWTLQLSLLFVSIIIINELIN